MFKKINMMRFKHNDLNQGILNENDILYMYITNMYYCNTVCMPFLNKIMKTQKL